MEAVADRIAVRWSEAFARHLPSSISQAVTAALEHSDHVFTVKKQKPAGAGPADAGSQTVCVHSAVCWKAAAQSTPATAASRGTSPRHLSGRSPASCRPLSPTPPVSKNKAKKVRKAAARAAAAVGAVSGPPVSAVAMQLAETVLPAVRSMLAADTTLAPLAPAATAERGHLHVTLRVPGSVPAAAGPELQALLRCTPAAASPAAAGADARYPGAAEGTSACEPLPVPDAAGGEPSDDSVDSDADWSPHSSSSCSEQRSREGDSGDAARPQWWLEDPPEGGWQLRTVLRPSSFVEEEYQLYQRYQRVVHKDPPGRASRGGYERFLVSTPWEGTVPRAADPDAPECGYGAFHMQYWLGEHLVAVGVWDILPRCAPLAPSHGHRAIHADGPATSGRRCRCLSSKYLIWDPDLPFLSLGKWTALQEVAWVRAAHAAGASTLRYAYLGLYIHSNQKMRCAATTTAWISLPSARESSHSGRAPAEGPLCGAGTKLSSSRQTCCAERASRGCPARQSCCALSIRRTAHQLCVNWRSRTRTRRPPSHPWRCPAGPTWPFPGCPSCRLRACSAGRTCWCTRGARWRACGNGSPASGRRARPCS